MSKIRVKIFWIALIILLFSHHPRAERESSRYFSLSVQDWRKEKQIVPPGHRATDLNFESELVLYGRIRGSEGAGQGGFLTFNDSMRFRIDSPFQLESFLSLDTLYNISSAGPKVVDMSSSPQYDSMLSCIFRGAALEVKIKKSGALHTIVHLKEDCGGGAYKRLNLPVSFGVFLTSVPPEGLRKDTRWTEAKLLPTYAGLGFFPTFTASCRVVQIEKGTATVVLSADTTIEEAEITLPSGEKAVLVKDEIHVAGTLVIKKGGALPERGEVRIEEKISLIRPALSFQVGKKECSYLLRFKMVYPPLEADR